MIQIKVDEDLPNLAIQLLRDKGYAATGMVEQGMGGWKDSDLWPVVQAEERFLITADKGFADTRLYPPGTHAGVLLLRPDEDGIRPILTLLQSVLSNFSLNALAGTVAVVTPRGIRIRRA
jgi:predicted nuclease of predicted toxin-antitoxin system